LYHNARIHERQVNEVFAAALYWGFRSSGLWSWVTG